MTAATSFGFSCWSDPAAVMTTAHQHNDLEFNLAGEELCYLVGGARIIVEAGRLAVFWGATPHQLIETEPDAVVTWLTVPLDRALGWRLSGETVRALLGGRVLTAPPSWTAAEAPRRFAQWREDLAEHAGVDATELAALEVEAFVRRFSRVAADAPAIEGGRPDPATRSVAAMAAFIAANFATPLRVADIAGAVHLHPHHATSLFTRALGVPPAAYLLKLRIGEAQRMLLRDDRAVADIAAACGFTSQSAFYEAFTSACGMPPGRWRRAHAAAGGR